MFQDEFLATIGEISEITEPQLKQEIEDLTDTRCVLIRVYSLLSEYILRIL